MPAAATSILSLVAIRHFAVERTDRGGREVQDGRRRQTGVAHRHAKSRQQSLPQKRLGDIDGRNIALIAQHGPLLCAGAFSSEAALASREENASKQNLELSSDSIGTEKALEVCDDDKPRT
jgi:hypothetical protein